MRKLILILTLSFSITAYSQSEKAMPDKRFDGLDTVFNRILKEWNCAGFAVAVVNKNKILYAKGFGYANYEKKIPVTENTLFAAGSCTKPFTCALLGILKHEGKVDFDKPAALYLPELKFYSEDMNKNIHVRDLMRHSTGLPRHDLSWGLFKTKSQNELLGRIQYLEPAWGLRQVWYYNNFMFLAQGMIIEKITGKSYEQYLREKILTPLGITNINFSVDTMVKRANFSYGYANDIKDNIQKTDYVNLDVMRPVGSINTSVAEMGKWMMLWLNNGKYQGQQILPESYINEAISAQMVVGGGVPSLKNPEVFFQTYGLGWFQSSYRGHYRVEHGGNITGFSTMTTFYPTDDLGIVIFTNQNASNNKVIASVRNLIADRILKLPYKDWQNILYAPVKAAKKAAKNQTTQSTDNASVNESQGTPSHRLSEYEGVYTNKGYGKFEVEKRNDSLFAIIADDRYWMKNYKYDVFDLMQIAKGQPVIFDVPAFRIVFTTNEGGSIKSGEMKLEPELPKPIEFIRTAKIQQLSNTELEKYTGDYVLSGQTFTVLIKNPHDLYLIAPGQPEYPLVAIEKDKFNIKDHSEVIITFKRDGNSVTKFNLIQPGVNVDVLRKK
jgi:CubicO group peptidase (beta-lactamase class C family)